MRAENITRAQQLAHARTIARKLFGEYADIIPPNYGSNCGYYVIERHLPCYRWGMGFRRIFVRATLPVLIVELERRLAAMEKECQVNC